MKRSYRLLLGLFVTLMCLAATAQAQSLLQAYKAKDGIPTAEKNAKDSLAADVLLTFIGTTGNFDSTVGGIPVTIDYNTTTGESTVWMYVYYSPSKQSTNIIAVAKVPFLGFQSINVGTLPIQLPFSDKSLPMTLTYSNSDKMQTRLSTDTAFTRYMKTYVGAKPTLVSLGDIGVDSSLGLPLDFPTNEPLWTMTFQGTGDEAMTCLVTAGTGATFCRAFATIAGVDDESTATSQARMTVVPNPTSARTRITVTLPTSARAERGVNAVLYNSVGQKVYELTESLVINDFQAVEFDARSLPAGAYFCRIAGKGFSITSDAIVVR